MSELEKKDEQRAAAEEAERKRKTELHAGKQGKQQDEPDVEEDLATGLKWDADVETFFQRMKAFSNDLGMSISSTDFRTLVFQYRDYSVMQKRVIANRLQRKGMHSFLRALHRGDYRLYQDTWQAEAEAIRNEKPSARHDRT